MEPDQQGRVVCSKRTYIAQAKPPIRTAPRVLVGTVNGTSGTRADSDMFTRKLC